MKRILLFILLIINLSCIPGVYSQRVSLPGDTIANSNLKGDPDRGSQSVNSLKMLQASALPVGDDFFNPIVMGSYGSGFQYTDTKQLKDYSDQYGSYETAYPDIIYQFTLTQPMTIIASLCNNSPDMFSYQSLRMVTDGNSGLLFNEGSLYCQNGMAYVQWQNLPAGTYKIIIEASYNTYPGTIILNVSGGGTLPPAPVVPLGDTKNKPIVAGSFSGNFNYNHSDWMDAFTNQFSGQSSKDVYYTFTTSTVMDLNVSMCERNGMSTTYLYLLNSQGSQITYSGEYHHDGCSDLSYPSLPAGTYYVVCELFNPKGEYGVSIGGTVPPPSFPGWR